MRTPQTMTEAIAMRDDMEREDFSARVRGEHADDKEFRRYAHGQIWMAHLRAKLHAEALLQAWDMIDSGVDIEMALSSIGDALDYVIPIAPERRHDDAATAGKSEGERELIVRGGRAEVHGHGKPNGGGADSRVVPEQS